MHYSIANLFRFLPFIRPVIGEAHDLDAGSKVFCSQLIMDGTARGGGFQLLRAASFRVAPGEVYWSPRLADTTLHELEEAA